MRDEFITINGFECRMISNTGRGPGIVLLHGYLYTSDVWNDIGLLRGLEQENIAFKAIDMPYGRKTEASPRSSDPGQNAAVLAEIASPDAVIVGASLGGYIALKHCVARPAGGLILVAPVMSLHRELAACYDAISARVCLIYGEADNVVHREEIKRLARLLHVSPRVYEKAQHAAYIDEPERFKKDVIEFYNRLYPPAQPKKT